MSIVSPDYGILLLQFHVVGDQSLGIISELPGDLAPDRVDYADCCFAELRISRRKRPV